MRIALVTEAPVNGKHGTGCVLLRLLAESGMEVVNIHPETLGAAGADMEAISVAELRRPWLQVVGALRRLARLIHPKLASLLPPPAPVRYRMSNTLRGTVAKADLVLGVVYSPFGLNFLHECLHPVQTLPPVLLWFMDCELTRPIPESMAAFLKRLSPAIWALTPEIKDTLSEVFPEGSDRIRVRSYLGLTLPTSIGQKEPHREHCRCVMIGSFWDFRNALVLSDIWSRTRAKLLLCQPLQWYATSEAARLLEEADIAVDPEISYQGFARPLDLSNSQEAVPSLDSILKEADLAVLPFSTSAHSVSNYARHSFPSRLTDYCAYGLPIFAIAHPESTVSRFVREHDIGVVHDGSSADGAAEALARYLTDPEQRAVHGKNARIVAERLFDIRTVRGKFLSDLIALAK